MKSVYSLILLLCYLSIDIAFAQYNRKASVVEFNHGLGVNIVYLNAPVSDGQAIIPAICYLPRVNCVRFSSNATISLKVPIVFFFVGSMNSQTGGSGAMYFDAAVALDFNYGMMATKESKTKIGFYGGVGLGYSPLTYNYVDYYTNVVQTSDKTIGLYGDLGVRFPALFQRKGKNVMPNNVGLYTIIGFNNILIAGLRVSKEFGYKGVKRKGW